MTDTAVLLDIGVDAYAHQEEVDEVRRRLGIPHRYFDCWIYGFLENKNFNIDETVAKLQRRADFERDQLATYNVTDWMMENMRKGIIQVIGNDKAGRVAFYIRTARDKPVSSRREESRRNFDMLLSYGTRLRPENKRCQITMLINQDKASMMSNLDMTFQADIALRIAKFYPGCVDKMYICKMGKLLAALAKPIFSRLPAIVSERIIIITEGDIRNGKLLELFDSSVLPTELGGANNCDRQENYDRCATITRDYFEQMKAALMRGEGVKEWELSCLRAAGYIEDVSRMDALRRSVIEPSASFKDVHCIGGCGTDFDLYSAAYSNQSMRTPRPSVITPKRPVRNIDDDANLVTCASDSARTDDLFSPLLVQHHSSNISIIPSRDLFADYISQFSTIESFFRLTLRDLHEQEWLKMVQGEVQERRALLQNSTIIQGDRLLMGLPPSILVLVKALLCLSLFVTSFYFFLGTCFVVLLGVLSLINTFFAMFMVPYRVFLFGAAFVVVACQFVFFCSRGVDLTRDTFEGRVVQGLGPFGAKALAVQVILSIVWTVACFIVFCVMAARYDILTGLQFSIAYGWIPAVCLIFLYHVVFAFGLRKVNRRSYGHGSRQNNAEVTLYLFMEVDMDDEQQQDRSPPSEVILLGFMGVLSVAMGVAFLVSGAIFFLCAAIVAQALLLLLSTTLMSSHNVGTASNIPICSVFYAVIFWMNILFTMPLHGWTGKWGDSMLTLLFLMLFFFVTGMVSIYGPWKGALRRWLFRVSWLLLLLHLISCLVCLFVYYYQFALFVMALSVHLLLCIVRTNEASNKHGVTATTACFTLVLLTCCYLGYLTTSYLYADSVSDVLLPGYGARTSLSASSTSSLTFDTYADRGIWRAGATVYPATMGSTSSAQVAYTMPPLCLSRFGRTLDVVGMALFAKLGLNVDSAAQDVDLGHWFPSFRRVSLAGTPVTDASVMHLDVFREETASGNTTVITARPSNNLMLSIVSMLTWIDVYAFSFFSFLMPPSYVEVILPYISFVQRILPVWWTTPFDESMDVLLALLMQFQGESETFYIVGHGPTGSRAAVMGLQVDANVHSVIFSGAPVVLANRGRRLTEEQVAHRVMFVQTMQTVFSTWYLRTASMQFIPCRLGGNICDSPDTMALELRTLCDGETETFSAQ